MYENYKVRVTNIQKNEKFPEYCAKDKIEHRSFRQIHSPRTSFPIFLYGILKALGTIIPMTKVDVISLAKILCRVMNFENVEIVTSRGTSDGRGWIGDVTTMHLDMSKLKKLG